MTPPVIVDGGDIVLPGCNPDWPASVTTTWSDNCGGSGTLTGVAGEVVDNGGCSQYRDYTFNVSDDCNNPATTVVIRVSRYYDAVPPVIVDGDDIVLPGCNQYWPAAVTTTWSDNCGGGGTITGVAGDVVTNGCTQYRDYTFNVSGGCGGDAVPVIIRVSRHWDKTPPVIVDSNDIVLPGCNPYWPASVTTTWSDNCGGSGTLTGVAGNVVTNGCTQYRDYTFNVSDDCNNPATTVVIRVSLTGIRHHR
jgi:hypothetical protein